MPIAAILGLLYGAAKSAAESQGRASDQRVSGATARYSPWTGMAAKTPRTVNTFGNLASGAATGLSMDYPEAGKATVGDKLGDAAGDVGNAIGSVPGKLKGLWQKVFGSGAEDSERTPSSEEPAGLDFGAPYGQALTQPTADINQGGVNRGLGQGFPSASPWNSLSKLLEQRKYGSA